jgi:hypothetical protein
MEGRKIKTDDLFVQTKDVGKMWITVKNTFKKRLNTVILNPDS